MVDQNNTSDRNPLKPIKIRESTMRRIKEDCFKAFKDSNPHDNRTPSYDFLINRMASYYLGEPYR